MTPSTVLKNGEKSKFSATNRRYPKRAAFEFYPTPTEAVRALLSVERFDDSIWEPACGDGAISKVSIEVRHQVASTDLIDRSYG